MAAFEELVEIWRGDFLESRHMGAIAVVRSNGELIEAIGDVSQMILPRSSCKILQALPLVESGAAVRFGLDDKRLALSCASHQGAAIHVDEVMQWLDHLGLSERDLRCGPQPSSDAGLRDSMIKQGISPDQCHNNCSGKHTGFLTLNRHLDGGAEYIDPEHAVQKAVRQATQEIAGEELSGFAIDGCSAPNFAMSLKGLATSMANLADPSGLGPARSAAATRLVQAMAEFPEMVAGEGRACTELMRAMGNGTVVKTGAEAVFTAILPSQKIGIALKIADGATRASEAAMAAMLVKYGVANANDPMVQKRLTPYLPNRRGINAARIQPAKIINPL